MRLALVRLVVVTLGLCAACSINEPTKGLPDGCLLNSDCDAGLVCRFGKCGAECAASRDCATGERCVKIDSTTTACRLPSDTACTFNSDCASPLVCAVDRTCRNECASDRDCLADQVCAASRVCADSAELDPAGNLRAAGSDSGP